jgi:Pilus formation protein N terminal region
MSALSLPSRRSLSNPLSAFLTATAAFGALLLDVPQARANDLIVRYDQSQLLRLPRPAAEIIIGNPTIADVAVQGGSLLVITGKSFGITNIIALDSERNVIQDQRIMVQRDEGRGINLHKGAKRESYNCSPQCNPSITIGDDTAYFDNVAKTTERKLKNSEGGADGGGANGQ